MSEIKIHSKPKGVRPARPVVLNGELPSGAKQVSLMVSAMDEYDLPSMAASLSMSPDEARELAVRLIASADGIEPRKMP